MSSVFGKIQAQELRNIKVNEPSLAYAAKPTSREVIFALDIPYPLFKSWYEFVQDIPQPEVETLTGSEKEKWEYATKYPFVALLEQAIPDQHFSFSSENDVRKEINESLRKICSNVVQKYKSNRGMARMKLNLCNKKFHVFKGQTEPVTKIRDDGARMTRNSNFILLSFSILQTGANVMSAKGNRTIAAVSASESYTTLKEAFGSVFEEINSFIASGKLTINDKTINLEFFLGGDYKFLLLMLGLKGATSHYACAWCKVHKDERWKTTNDFNYYNKPPMARTLKELVESCTKSKDNFCCEHKPLINIDLDHVIVDELHLMLRISDVLTNNIVNEVIDWDREDDWDKKGGEEKGIHLKNLISAIRSLGITFDVWEKRNVDQSSSGKYDWTSLMGTEKKILLNQLPQKLNDVLRPDTSSAVSKLWLNFNSLYNLINNWEPNTLPSTFGTQAGKWIDEFCSLSGKLDGYESKRVTPYMHIMFAHIPHFFKLYKGIKIFTGQGVEKNNDVARSVVHRKSNKWNAVAHILQQEHRQWHLRDRERDKRSYSKHKSDYWEADIRTTRQKRRRINQSSPETVCGTSASNTQLSVPDINDINPEKLTVKELKQELSSRNIKGLSKMNKVDLIQLLKNALGN